MKTIRKMMRLDKLEYYEKHLSIINSLLPVTLTPKEIEVLAAFMSLEPGLKRHMFETTARKEVMDMVGITPGGLGNYLKSLKSKGFIVKEDNKFVILPILVPEEKEQDYQFKLLVNGSNS